MKVYRCENEKGEGPWRAKYSFYDLLDPETATCWLNHGNGLPTLNNEIPEFNYTGNKLSAATMSEEQFEEWFGPFEEQLKEHGFVRQVYEVPESYVLKGKKQVAFDKSKAKKVAR